MLTVNRRFGELWRRLGIPPGNLNYWDGLFEPLGLELAKSTKWNIFPNQEITHDLRYENASGFGVGAQPGGEVDCSSI